MKTYNVIYKGYKNNKYMFELQDKRLISLYANEVCPLLDNSLVVKLLNGCIGQQYILGVYPPNNGLYIKERYDKNMGIVVYDIYDALTNKFINITIKYKEDIPDMINNQKVHKFGKKIILSKVNNE